MTSRLLRELSQRSDLLGILQAGGHLASAFATGFSVHFLFKAGFYSIAIILFIVHGTICSFLAAGLHELCHGTVFKSKWLNLFFRELYGSLILMRPDEYWRRHVSHHQSTLFADDQEKKIVTRDLKAADWAFECVFNLPALLTNLFFADPRVLIGHLLLGIVFVFTGNADLILIITLAPYSFGAIQFLCTFLQHKGMSENADDLRRSCRSIRLPGWLSFLYWHMEFHIEHHMYPSVPCYRLWKLSEALERELPIRNSMIIAWRRLMEGESMNRLWLSTGQNGEGI
jgi:fatty acid desaturase